MSYRHTVVHAIFYVLSLIGLIIAMQATTHIWTA